MINSFPIQEAGRQPRGIFQINGTTIPFEKWVATNNNIYEADTFNAQIALSGNPSDFDDQYFFTTGAMLVNIFGGFPTNPQIGQYSSGDLQSVFIGQVDNLDYDPLTNCINLKGRDLTAKFIDNKTTEKFQNLTSSQIITLLANRRGLNPIVTPTTTLVGTYYQNDNTVISSERPEWDLMVYLAQQENFIIYVDGTNLIFEPTPDPTSNPYTLTWQKTITLGKTGSPSGSIINPKFYRSLTIANDVIVRIRSWNKQTKQSYTTTATATHTTKTVLSGLAQPIGDAQRYSRVVNGLTKQQTIQLAQQELLEISKQELNLTFDLPADTVLKKNSILQTTGFCSALNQIFYPDNITRSMSNISADKQGYKMSVHAKNHSPVSTVIV